MSTPIETRELTPDMWPMLERLFGANGACGGCWCMSWRVQKGEDWQAIKGDEAKQRFQALVEAGHAHGVLAFADGEPIGWCSFDRRVDYAKLDRAPSLKCDDAAQVWSIPCFYVQRKFQGQGVAKALLAHALQALERRGAAVVEGYPVKPSGDGKKSPAAFAWTGTRRLFDAAGFQLVGDPAAGKHRVRKDLSAARPSNPGR